MDVFEAIRTLLAVRRFRDKPVPEDVLRRVLEAGRLSASAANKQPWHFVVVQDSGMLRQLGTAARSGPYISEAPLAIVVAIEPSQFALADADRAIQDMLLTAWDAGVGRRSTCGAGAQRPMSFLVSRESSTWWRSCRLATPPVLPGKGKRRANRCRKSPIANGGGSRS